jgi:tetratricopeptide (TPR) repeat protein
MLRDGLKFLWLTLIAILLGGVTTFLFRSFEGHREALAERWSTRGRDALQQEHPADAVRAFRTSLTYRPDDRENQLALAQALAASGHTAEAENYFVNLWQGAPGDGPINLQLARLERTQNEPLKAIDYYRAAVFGTWSGDGPARRRDTRLELSNYLIERGQRQAAEAELLIAAGNNPDGKSQITIGDALERAGDPRDAMTAYRNATQIDNVRRVAQAKAGELCYRMGDYGCAESLLEKALHFEDWTDEQRTRMTALQQNAGRIQELAFSNEVKQPVRTVHLLEGARIAKARLKACAAQNAAEVALQELQGQWATLDSAKNRSALRHDDDLQAQFSALIYETETSATGSCGAPTGDDALLLQLRDHPMTHFGAQ